MTHYGRMPSRAQPAAAVNGFSEAVAQLRERGPVRRWPRHVLRAVKNRHHPLRLANSYGPEPMVENFERTALALTTPSTRTGTPFSAALPPSASTS